MLIQAMMNTDDNKKAILVALKELLREVIFRREKQSRVIW